MVVQTNSERSKHFSELSHRHVENSLVVNGDAGMRFGFVIPFCVICPPWARILVSGPWIPKLDESHRLAIDKHLVSTEDGVSMTSHKTMLILEYATGHNMVSLLTIGNYLPKGLFIILMWIVHREMWNDWHSCQSSQRLKCKTTR
jgi:hypothetical protein